MLIHFVPLGEWRTRGDDGIRSKQVKGAPVHPITIMRVHQDIQPYGAGMAYITPLSIVTKWFPDKKGLAGGLVAGAFGLGAFVYNHRFRGSMDSTPPPRTPADSSPQELLQRHRARRSIR